MLHILLMILKIIGIIVGVLLGLLVLAVLVILITPLRYEIHAVCKGTIESLKVSVRFSWLFHLLAGQADYEEKKTKWKLRILWKKFPTEEHAKETVSAPLNEADSTENISAQSEKESKASDERKVCETKETPQIAMEEPQQAHAEKTQEEKKQKKPKREKKTLWDKIKYTFQKICDKIKVMTEKKEKLQEFIQDEVHQQAFRTVKKELFRLLHFLKPKKLSGRIHFGLEEPCDTGRLLGWLSMFYPFYGDQLELEPDFQEKVLEGELHIEGKIRPGYGAIVFFRILISKEVRTTFQHIRKFKL